MSATLQSPLERYPGALVVKPTEGRRLLDQSRQSTYNQVCAGRFPIPLVIDRLNRKMVRLIDLANYIDSMTVVQPRPSEPRKNDLPKGRPTKVEEAEAKHRGCTVPELRAQRSLAGLQS